MVEGLDIKLCVVVSWLVANNSVLVVFFSVEVIVDNIILCDCVGLMLYVCNPTCDTISI